MDRSAVGNNNGRSQYSCDLRFRIVMKRIRIKRKVRILQTYAIIKNSQLRSRRILSVERRQLVQGVNDQTSVEIITDIRNTFIVQAIGKKRYLAVFHTNIFPQISDLRIPVIKQVISIHEQGIPLLHPHIAESFQRVGRLKKVSTVAVHV